MRSSGLHRPDSVPRQSQGRQNGAVGVRRRRCQSCDVVLAADNTARLCGRCHREQRDQLFSAPIRQPDDFFDTDEFRAAFASQHIGKVLRTYRNHPRHVQLLGKALNQEMLGRWLGLTQAQVSKVENGKPDQNLQTLRRYAEILHLPQLMLWFDLPGQSRLGDAPSAAGGDNAKVGRGADPTTGASLAVANDSSLWAPSLDTATLAVEFTRRDLALNRRELHRLLVTVFVGGPLLDYLERWITAPSVNSGGSALPQQLLSVGSSEIEELESAAKMFRDWDDRFGGGLRRKAVIGQLNEVSELVSETAAGPLRRRLYRVMAQLAETAAMMSWDSGLQPMAQRYYILAIRAARAGDDPAFAANALAGMARQFLYMGHPADALEVIRLAQSTCADTAGGRIMSMLATREAWAYAHLGRMAAFERATATAEYALGQAEDVSSEPYWIHYFDSAELHGTIGGRLLEVAQKGRPEHAAAAIDRIGRAIRERADGHLRSSSLDLIGLSQAYMLSGNLDEGVRIGITAVAAADKTSSDRVQLMLRDFYRDTEPHARSAELKDLRARVACRLADNRPFTEGK
jgi:DNA-binding XRE family transcriptional regulator